MRCRIFIFPLLGLLFAASSSSALNVSVKDFGARGDGKTDDRLAIQAAIDAVGKAGGGTVRLPEGTFLVRALHKGKNSPPQIKAANGVTLQGDGMEKSIIKVADEQGAWGALFGASRLKDFTMRDLGIDANGAANNCVPNKPGGSGDDCPHILVRLLISTNVTIQRCHFFNHSGVWVIVCFGSEKNLVVDSCVFDRIGGFTVDFDHSTIYTQGNGPVTISNNVFASKDGPGTTGARTAIELHGSNQKVVNNTIRGFRYGINVCTGPGNGPDEPPTVNQQYLGNTITGVGGCFVFWSLSPAGFDNLLIQDNKVVVDIPGWKKMYPGETRGMFQTSAVRGPVRNLVIRHNTLSYLGPEGYGPSCDRHAGMWLGAAPGAKSVLSLRDLTVDDNTIQNAPGAGIVLTAQVDGAKLRGNRIINPGQAAGRLTEKYASGIVLSGTMKNVVVENNQLIDDQSAGTMKAGIWEETLNQGGCIAANSTLKIKNGARVTPVRLNPAQKGMAWTLRDR